MALVASPFAGEEMAGNAAKLELLYSAYMTSRTLGMIHTQNRDRLGNTPNMVSSARLESVFTER